MTDRAVLPSFDPIMTHHDSPSLRFPLLVVLALSCLFGSGCGSSAPETPDPSTGEEYVEGVVDIAPELQAKIADGARLYIILRAADGTDKGRPVSVATSGFVRFPYRFLMTESGRMNAPMFAKQGFDKPMTLHARLGQKGNPVAAAGDLQGDCPQNPVVGGTRGLTVTIDRVLTADDVRSEYE